MLIISGSFHQNLGVRGNSDKEEIKAKGRGNRERRSESSYHIRYEIREERL